MWLARLAPSLEPARRRVGVDGVPQVVGGRVEVGESRPLAQVQDLLPDLERERRRAKRGRAFSHLFLIYLT